MSHRNASTRPRPAHDNCSQAVCRKDRNAGYEDLKEVCCGAGINPEGVDGYCGCGCLGSLDIVYDDADLDAAVAVNRGVCHNPRAPVLVRPPQSRNVTISAFDKSLLGNVVSFMRA